MVPKTAKVASPPLAPPEHLCPAEAAIWREVVDSKPADWFDGPAAQMLSIYCQTVADYDDIRRQLREISPKCRETESGFERYMALHRLQDQKLGRSQLLATKMRLTIQSRYRADKAATENDKAAPGARPWVAKR